MRFSPRPRHLPVASVAATALLGSVALPVIAHHSAAIFDLERSVMLEGVVTRYDWVNPHVYLYVDTSNGASEPSVWEIEASPPTLMVQRGWSPDSFVPGDHLTVEANPAKNASRRMALGRTVRIADGRTLVMSRNRNTNPAASAVPDAIGDVPPPVAANDPSGTWQSLRLPGGFVMQFIFGPTSWALTDAGAAAVEAYDDTTNPAVGCIAYTAPFTMVFPDLKFIALGEDVTTIRSSLESAERIIHMGVETHDGAPFSNQGHSIGRWEGRTLVVDTARFEARLNGNAFRLPSSRQKHLVERLALSDDRTRLFYQIELQDPEYLAETVVGEAQWAYAPGREFAAQGCDLGNARRFLDGWVD